MPSAFDFEMLVSDGDEEYTYSMSTWINSKFEDICSYLGKCYLAGYKIEGSGSFYEGHYIIEDPRIGRVERRWNRA